MRHHLKNGLWSLFVAFLLCLSLSSVALAQEETAATITGQVTDSTGAVIPGATIVVTFTETNTERRVQANEDGNYVVTTLQPGTYTVSVEQPNLKRYLQTL